MKSAVDSYFEEPDDFQYKQGIEATNCGGCSFLKYSQRWLCGRTFYKTQRASDSPVTVTRK